MTLEHRVLQNIRTRGLAGPATRIVAALSGGSDSVALVHLLRALDAAGQLQLVALLHFNHRLRPEADADQQFCAAIGQTLNLPVVTGEQDVRGLARREHRSIEAAGRTARHRFFEQARVDCRADVVAVGHTRDDQAETFLLRLLRGAGATGLAAMHPRNGHVIRPLLECRREELAAYLSARGLAFVADASNADVSIPRNRVRAELLPLLADRFNPSVVDALANAAELAREDWTWLDQAAAVLAEQAADSVVDLSCNGRHGKGPERRIGLGEEEPTVARLALDAALLAGAPVAIARAALRQLMTRAAAGRFITFDAVERALNLCRGSGADFDAPGQRVQRIGSHVVLLTRPPDAVGRSWPSRPAADFQYSLAVPGEVAVPETGYVVEARGAESARGSGPGVFASSGASSGAASDTITAAVRRDLCGTALVVRNRRPGDRFRPAGLRGHKKLQDFFVDRKVDRRLRDRVPLVVDESNRIVWVAGHALNEDFRVTDLTQAVLILRLKGVGGAV